jgi:lysozyme
LNTIYIGLSTWEGKPIEDGMVITEESGRIEFLKQISSYQKCINDNVKYILNQNQWDALFCLVWNIGCSNFKSSTLLKKININPNDKSIAQEFTKWDKAGGKVVDGLLRRRLAETQLYFKK